MCNDHLWKLLTRSDRRSSGQAARLPFDLERSPETKMPFHIFAWLEEGGTGTVNVEAATKQEAFVKARGLLELGFRVRVSDPDGNPVTEDE